MEKMDKFERSSDNVMFLYVGEGKRKPKSPLNTLTKKISSNIQKATRVLRTQIGRSQASPLKEVGTQAADLLDKSADYIEDLDAQKLRDDVENQVRRNPSKSLLIAGATGLFLGSVFTRRK